VTRHDPTRGGFLRRSYRLLLRIYPEEFRAQHEEDLLQAFDDRRREPRFRGMWGGMRLAALLARDLTVSLPLARREGPGRDAERRRGRGEEAMGDLKRDLRYAVRMLAKNPLFSAAAVLTLALGIGLNAASFSAVEALLLEPLAGVEEPDELVQLYRSWPGIEYGSNSIPHYRDVRDRTGEVFEEVAAWKFAPVSFSADGTSERLMGLMVSANFFQTFGAEPGPGRAFLPGEESEGAGAHPVVVLGHEFWQSRFGGDPEVVGRTLLLNGSPFEVVGVAPADFRGPVRIAAPPLYVPLVMTPVVEPGSDALESRGSNSMTVVARLRDGVGVERAQEAMDALLLQLRDELPRAYDEQVGAAVVPQGEAGIHPTLRSAQVGLSTVVMVVVGLLLLIACVNVANLFLARARDRRREIGLRLSLGASRRQVGQQLLTESVLFSLVAGAAGLGLAHLAIGLLDAFRPPIDGPWELEVTLDGSVLLFTLGVSVAAGLLFGMAPALQALRPDTLSAVKGEVEDRAGSSRMGKGLVVVQMALSILLLVGAGLFLRSLQSATRIDPGFEDPSSLVMASVDPGLQGYDDPRARVFFDRVRERVAALPSVRSVGMVDFAPLGLNRSDQDVDIPGYEFAPGEAQHVAYARADEGYFETLGVELVEGRGFTRADDAQGPPVIVVNRAFAERFWPGEPAVGRIVGAGGAERRVVGVTETGKYHSLGEDPTPFMYFPHRERFRTGMTLVARVDGDAGQALGDILAVVRELDPDLPLFDVRTMESHMGIALLPARLGGSVLGLFGLLGVVLAGVGVYGVMAYSVSTRTREMGIRVALGADRERVLRLVVGEGMKLTLLGAALGLAAAAAASRLVAGLLYGVPALDPVAFVGVPVILMAVAALAVWLPARRAARTDPMQALRTE
jgi:predicted permease